MTSRQELQSPGIIITLCKSQTNPPLGGVLRINEIRGKHSFLGPKGHLLGMKRLQALLSLLGLQSWLIAISAAGSDAVGGTLKWGLEGGAGQVVG